MQALLIKPFSWDRFVPHRWSRLEQPVLLLVLTFSWMIAIPLLPQSRCCLLGTAIDATHTNVLALQSSAAGSATNVGVQILDRTGAALALDGATFSSETTLNNGTNTIPFRARYFATGAATPGAANADATFRFSINNLPRFRDVITGRMPTHCDKITMKRKRLFLLASLLPMFALAGNKWNTTLPGGNMQFQGVIIAGNLPDWSRW